MRFRQWAQFCEERLFRQVAENFLRSAGVPLCQQCGFKPRQAGFFLAVGTVGAERLETAPEVTYFFFPRQQNEIGLAACAGFDQSIIGMLKIGPSLQRFGPAPQQPLASFMLLRGEEWGGVGIQCVAERIQSG